MERKRSISIIIAVIVVAALVVTAGFLLTANKPRPRFSFPSEQQANSSLSGNFTKSQLITKSNYEFQGWVAWINEEQTVYYNSTSASIVVHEFKLNNSGIGNSLSTEGSGYLYEYFIAVYVGIVLGYQTGLNALNFTFVKGIYHHNSVNVSSYMVKVNALVNGLALNAAVGQVGDYTFSIYNYGSQTIGLSVFDSFVNSTADAMYHS